MLADSQFSITFQVAKILLDQDFFFFLSSSFLIIEIRLFDL